MTALTAQRKVGPNDKCSCGSDKKAKKCCFSNAVRHTPIQTEHGKVLPGSPVELKELANQALRASEHQKAVHLYTMAIDSLAKGLKIDQNGKAADADLFELNETSEGELAKLLSNRSLAYLKLGDIPAAVEDAETCTRTEPSFEKGHLRLLVALEAFGAPLQQRLEACEMGLDSCPQSEVLVTHKWKLKKTIASKPSCDQQPTSSNADDELSPIEMTRRVADDPSHPRRDIAATDLGSSLAVGAHGLDKDLVEAERYLRIGADAGEMIAQRNLGILLLELNRPAEAAQELRRAADAGDEQAAETLHHLLSEVDARKREARERLQEMAERGDARAIQMLQEIDAELP